MSFVFITKPVVQAGTLVVVAAILAAWFTPAEPLEPAVVGGVVVTKYLCDAPEDAVAIMFANHERDAYRMVVLTAEQLAEGLCRWFDPPVEGTTLQRITDFYGDSERRLSTWLIRIRDDNTMGYGIIVDTERDMY